MKEEIIKSNNLITNIVEDFKINLDKKIREKDSREIEDTLKNVLIIFSNTVCVNEFVMFINAIFIK